MIIVQFVEQDDIIVFADVLKGEDFIRSLPKREIRENKIIITRT